MQGSRGGSAEDRRVFLIRHGEGMHNVRQSQGSNDPPLTENGKGQARALRGRSAEFDLLIVSPLSRAIETAALIFGERPACRTIISPLHSERWSGACDEGRSKSALAAAFPFIREWEGFSTLAENWTPTQLNDGGWVKVRVPKFLEYLRQQPERRIAVVGHGGFFGALVGRPLKNCEVAELREGSTRT
jgi:broad specificity phosphatase PhoE